jgi:hypothetical protein
MVYLSLIKKLSINKALFILALFCFFDANASTISGTISDEKHEPLPFAGVFIAGTTIGTTANADGQYRLELKPGNYELTYKMIGYTAVLKKVVIADLPQVLDVQLTMESFNLKVVEVKANAEDPAYEIIRNAQKKRGFFRERVSVYYCDAYVKSTQRLIDHPDKFMGQKVDVGEILDTVTKMYYLSESVSHLFYKHPNEFKEEMVSSKVSGDAKTYSFNQSTDVLINLYDNLVEIADISPRGIISPISSNALFSYKYRLEGSFIENGKMINKISVIPKRINDPVFTGTIYIADDDWYIHSADLFITKNQQMEFLDTFRLKETFIVLDKDIVLPFNHQLSYSFKVFGFEGDGIVIGVFNNYDLGMSTPKLPGRRPPMKKGEVLKVNIDANKKDSSYWEQVRPIPLTTDEALDYHRRDSARKVTSSQAYMDSIDRKDNKFEFNSIFYGYSWSNTFKGRSYSIGSPLLNIDFNTVEGWNSHMSASYEKTYGDDDRRLFSMEAEGRYGLSNTHFNGHLTTTYRYNPKNLSIVTFDAGSYVYQFNSSEAISPLVNGVYTLLAEKNFMKIYEKSFLSFIYRSELINGFEWRWNVEYAQRSRLNNTTDYKFRDVKDREYTPNVAASVEDPGLGFPVNESFTIDLQTKIRFGLKYINRPEAKYNIGTKFPTLRLEYKKGIKIFESDVDYDLVKAQIDDEMKAGLLGRFKYQINYSKFLSAKDLYFTDFLHFNGNKTIISAFRMNDFRNLPYYEFSSKDWAFEAHAEQNFGGFLLNKIPLIRKLKLKEVAGFHYLKTPQLDNYMEVSIGVEKLNSFRLEGFTSFMEGKRGTIGFMLGITKRFGNF